MEQGAYLEVRAGSAQLGERDEAFGAGEAVGPAEHGEDGADRVERVPAVELAWGGVCEILARVGGDQGRGH